MSPNLEFLTNQIQCLPFQDRNWLIRYLISTIDKGDDTDSEELWLREAEKRYQLWRDGKISSKPASAVLF